MRLLPWILIILCGNAALYRFAEVQAEEAYDQASCDAGRAKLALLADDVIGKRKQGASTASEEEQLNQRRAYVHECELREAAKVAAPPAIKNDAPSIPKADTTPIPEVVIPTTMLDASYTPDTCEAEQKKLDAAMTRMYQRRTKELPTVNDPHMQGVMNDMLNDMARTFAKRMVQSVVSNPTDTSGKPHDLGDKQMQDQMNDITNHHMKQLSKEDNAIIDKAEEPRKKIREDLFNAMHQGRLKEMAINPEDAADAQQGDASYAFRSNCKAHGIQTRPIELRVFSTSATIGGVR